ncbi:hypothetical protein U2S91_09425 [Stenotrophomonas maltophilia]|nr:hypothetical protein [Stenotrophomonas maltophilia]WQI22829.1 hypothetical protein U2S91_09425 [Stenotrophomonas maltophilia]
MAKQRVPLHQNPRSFTTVEEGATKGAQVGVDLLGPDGTVLRPDQVINPATSTDPNANRVTVWKLIREVPGNLVKIAALVGKGFAARRGDGEWTLRTLQPGGAVAVTNGDGEAGNPVIGLTDDALASLALADSAVQQVRPGANITVDTTDPRRPIVSASGSGGVLPVVTGEIVAGQPVFLIADDGNLIYTEIS